MIARGARIGSWAALTALALLARRRPRIAAAAAALLTGTIGVAHGAVDDRILADLLPRFPGGRAGIGAAYGAVVAAVFVPAQRWPRSAHAALAAIAAYHFGSGDAALARACGGRTGGVLQSMLRGALPLLAHRPACRPAALILAGALAFADACRGALAEACDSAVPAIAVAATPAPLGFALYFGAWHAPRHLALLLECDPRGGRITARLARFAREAAINTLLAIALAAAAVRLRRSDDPRDLFAAFTLAITVPHQAAVWYAQRRADAAGPHKAARKTMHRR